MFIGELKLNTKEKSSIFYHKMLQYLTQVVTNSRETVGAGLVPPHSSEPLKGIAHEIRQTLHWMVRHKRNP